MKTSLFQLRHKHKYVLLEIDQDGKNNNFSLIHLLRACARFGVESQKEKTRQATSAIFKALPKKTAIYALYDLALKTRDGRRINKAYLVCWTPKSCNTEYKVMYTSQRGKLVGEFDGLKLCNASSLKELDSELGIEDESDSDDDEWDPDAL